jgi:PAS domain S-box-containing protein
VPAPELLLLCEEAHAMVLGLDGRIRFWNRAAEKLYGWSRKEAIGAVSHQLLKTECSAPVGY